MILYAYIPDENGKEPCGSANKLLRHDLKDTRRFVRQARTLLGDRCRVIVNYGSFYRPEDDKVIWGGVA